jgi:hypothetical protein
MQDMHGCVPIQCGCGSASCTGFRQSDDVKAQEWHPPNSVLHGADVTVTCAVGHRASNDVVSRCTASTTYRRTCKDCIFRSSLNCRPVTCGRFEDWPTYDISKVESVKYILLDGRKATGSDDVTDVPYLTQATVSCREGFRARPLWSEQEPQHSDPQIFKVTCMENCAFLPAVECARLKCPSFSPVNGKFVAGDVGFLGRDSMQLGHAQHVRVQCNSGYKMSGNGTHALGGGACLRSFNASCHLGNIVTMNAVDMNVVDGNGQGVDDGADGLVPTTTPPPSVAKVHGYQASCVPIDCAAGDMCGTTSGGLCSPLELRTLDPLCVPPTLYYGGPLQVFCAKGSAAVRTSQISSSCNDPPFYSYSCTDCMWRAEGDYACKPQMCNVIEPTGFKTVIPAVGPGRDAYPATSEWPPRAYTGQTLTVVCVQGSRVADINGPGPDALAPEQFNLTCMQGCKYRGLKACVPLSCGRFVKGLGMQVLLHAETLIHP